MALTGLTDAQAWLSLSGDPADEGLYFVGALERRITFYSQQVRALRLVRALVETGKVKPDQKVVVVGAGAAGVTAAVALAFVGAEVTLYDPASSVLQLQSASERLLHPHIYEWPDLGSLDDQAGLPLMDWEAASGGVVCQRLKAEFAQHRTAFGARLLFKGGHVLKAVERDGTQWRLKWAADAYGAATLQDRVCKIVVLAMGFGSEEACAHAETLGYWKSGSVDAAAAEPHAGARYFVSGAGDGGLTDMMALLVQDFQHVTFAREIVGAFEDNALALATTTAINGTTLDEDLAVPFAERLLPLLSEHGVLDSLRERLRSDRRLTLNSERPILASGRAARLNQVLAYAVIEAAKTGPAAIAYARGRMGAVTPNGEVKSVALTSSAAIASVVVERVICRHGPATAARYGVAAAPFERYDRHLQKTLKAKPELQAPPVLDAQTFEFFDQLKSMASADLTVQALHQAAAARREGTILISQDAASHELVVHGAWDLADVVNQAERLVNPVTLQFSTPPAATPGGEHWPRLAKASGGRILLTAQARVLADWRALDSNVGEAQPLPPKYRPKPLIAPDLAAAINACLLRRVDHDVCLCLDGRDILELEAIDPDLRAALKLAWEDWREKLEKDPTLCAAFLGWLFTVEPSAARTWDGDSEMVSWMASALVLMIATHLTEAMVPVAGRRGNMEFAAQAVALGSGCRRGEAGRIDGYTAPEQWDGVDALILAGASELYIVQPSDRVMTGGKPSANLRDARRVVPALVQNNIHWRSCLRKGGDVWKQAVEDEFAAWRQRQDKAFRDAIR